MVRPVPVGPFLLLEPVGRGGMAEVWRGVHASQGVSVAVKVFAVDAVKESQQRRAFRDEVRAVAGLYHPGVVMVFDIGEVDESAASLSQGRLEAGSPYLAMEYASGGSLTRVRRPLPWSQLGALLLALLDALAHAHARGVVHRDLKPGNVLLCTPSDPRPGLKLTDFGIARAMDRYSHSGSVDAVMGTAHYMAPEQVEGLWRDQGPWTDLYALGCVAYRLATGRRPFEGRQRFDLLRAQLYDDPPPLVPGSPAPRGYADWVSRLMAKRPERRFQCAADAAAELASLGPAPNGEDLPADLSQLLAELAPAPQEDTLVRVRGLDHTETTRSEPTLLPGLGELVTAVHELDTDFTRTQPADATSTSWVLPYQASAAEHLPATWRHALPPDPPMQLRGAGLGLLGMRQARLMGREAQRDALWEALLEVHATRQPRVVVIRGPRGSGRSRLVRWLGERTHELGAAAILGCTALLGDPEGAALGRMVSMHLGCVRLKRQAVEERVERFLSRFPGVEDSERGALVELISPGAGARGQGGVGSVRLESPTERYEVVRVLARRLGVHRPVILWVDDAHHAEEDALGLAAHLLARRGAPVLVIMSLDEQVLGESPRLGDRVAALLEHPKAWELALEPLPGSEMAALVRELLGLEQSLAAHVEQRSGGNPLFAVQLVTEWAHRGLLTPSPAGFVLSRAATEALPGDLRAVSESQLGRILAGLPAEALVDLERAAALGQEVDMAEWREACGRTQRAHGGHVHRSQVLDRLVERRLAKRVDGGWQFRHAAFRELLLDSARRHGRWEQHHRAAAEVLLRRAAQGHPVAKERLGRHLVEAGRRAEALDVLLEGVIERSEGGGTRVALALLGRAERVMGELGLPRQDPRWARAWMLRARLLLAHGDMEQAEAWARRSQDAAREQGWRPLALRAAYELARAHKNQMRLDEAEAGLERVRLGAIQEGEQELVGLALLLLAEVAGHRHRHKRALIVASDAHRVLAEHGDSLQEAAALRLMGLLQLSLGEVGEAARLQRQALALCEHHGSRAGMAASMNNYAEALRAAGSLEQAEEAYDQARQLFEAVGDWQAVLSLLNLGLVRLGLGRFSEARAGMEEARQGFEERGARHLLGSTCICLLPAVAHDGDWATWDRYLRRGRDLLDETRFAHEDNAWAAGLAAELALAVGQRTRAVAAWRLARDQYASTGQADKADRVAARLAAMVG